nr:hypothetical protein [Candidatus Sigynarchaeum springense]
MPARESYGMGKKPGKATEHDGGEEIDLDQFTREDFDFLDDRARVAEATPEPLDLPCGKATRTLRELEVALLPAIAAARELFRAAARAQPYSPPDPSLSSIFSDYRHYLRELKASAAESGEEPAEALDEYDACIAHVLDCLGKMRRGEGITRVDALKADAWLRDVPGETLVFN